MKFDVKNEEKTLEKIQTMKSELKELEKESNDYEGKLKEQRLIYSNLNLEINKIKEKINLIRGNGTLSKNKSNEVNYEDELLKLSNEIEDEEKLYNEEENEYKKILIDNEKEIKRLSEEIIKKKELLENKGKKIRNNEIIKQTDNKSKLNNIPILIDNNDLKNNKYKKINQSLFINEKINNNL